MSKMIASTVMTMTNNKKERSANFEKQSQTKPILSRRSLGRRRNANKKSRRLAGFLNQRKFTLPFVFVFVLIHFARFSHAGNMVVRNLGLRYRPFGWARGKLVSGVGFIVGFF